MKDNHYKIINIVPLCSKESVFLLPSNFLFIIANLQIGIHLINQSNFYSANIPGKARLSGVTAESVFNSKIAETVP